MTAFFDPADHPQIEEGFISMHAIGSKVTFKPGPKSTSDVTATVTGHAHPFLVTKDAAGKERKVRNGAARAA